MIPQEHKKTRKQLADAKVEEFVRTLAAEMEQGYSPHFEAYMQFLGKGHTYSPYNTTYIFVQALIYGFLPSAVKGRKQWEADGLYLKDGEWKRSLEILIPIFSKGIDPETNEPTTYVSSFKLGWVFDLSQMKNPPVSRPPLGNDYAYLYELFCTLIRAEGIKIEEKETVMGMTNGSSAGGKITIKSTLDGTNKFLVLVHEYTHEKLHQRGSEYASADTATRECHAEAVSYAVAQAFGIDCDYSKDYLKHWNHDNPKVLLAELQVVTRTALSIIRSLQKALAQQEEKVAA